MAARAIIALNDGQTTPVAHNFSPMSGDGNVPGVSMIGYEDRSGGIPAGFPTISFATRRPTKTNRNYRLGVVITVPVLETVSNSTVTGIAPAPTTSYKCQFRSEWILPERSSKAVRQDLRAYVKSLMVHATLITAVEDLESPW